ncbi:DUF2752 domain-containing protein [Streptomyces sp. NPDC012623]|uniref:DUF2752 domain-containing protein n=1 Tax=unclassified Streptomyces TaxID=2593676 RepID=UPI0036B6E8DD
MTDLGPDPAARGATAPGGDRPPWPPGPRQPPRARRAPGAPRGLLPPLATLAAIGAAFTYVGLVDPNESGHYPVCPLYALTGLYCPGCGGLRSAHAVAHGDLVTALGANAVAVAGYAVFAVGWLVWLVRARKGLPAPLPRRPVHWWAIGAVFLVFTVVRNLPFGSWLAP